MNDTKKKLINRNFRRKRSRSKITGTTERPRLSVKISATNVSAQVINDETGQTVASASTIGAKAKGTMTEKATAIGDAIAKDAKTKKVSKVVLDRGEKKYHGRLKALADAARKGGLEF